MNLRYSLLLTMTIGLLGSTAFASTVPSYYTLDEVVMLSRHSIRSPIDHGDHPLDKVTNHKWFKWTSAPGELSVKGGQLETLMGQYYRQYLTHKGLIPHNYVPKEGEVKFYADSCQRCVASTHYFSSGMLPVANPKVDYRYGLTEGDPTFDTSLTFINPTFKKKAMKEIEAFGGKKGLVGITEQLAPNFKTVEKVLGKPGLFNPKDIKVKLELGKEPKLSGALKLGNSVADALVLQYYEEPNDLKAGFGHKISDSDWKKIGYIKAIKKEVKLDAPLIAVNIAHPMLIELYNEVNKPGRKFTYLGGHDSNISSVLAALGVKPYCLPDALECKVPIGSKFVIEKYTDTKNHEDYVKLTLVYQSLSELRNREYLSLDHPPLEYDLQFKGLKANADGLYKLKDFNALLLKTIKEYDKLKAEK